MIEIEDFVELEAIDPIYFRAQSRRARADRRRLPGRQARSNGG
jgi:hypothetical protein